MQSARNVTLDLLRGLFLCIIIVDHVFRFPNFFELFTGRGQLWISAAEGFFLVSGLLVGILRQPFQKLWKRSGQLYLLSIGLTLLFTLMGHFLPTQNLKAGLWIGSYSKLLLNSILFRYTYGWADFLPYYAVFLFFAPLVLNMLRKWGALPVVIISGVVWVVRGTNFYAAWQLLFVLGIVGGYYLPLLEKRLYVLRRPLILIMGFGLLASAIWVFKIDPSNLNLLVKQFFDKDTLGLGRVILALTAFWALYLNSRSYEAYFYGAVGNFLRVFGRNSLATYIIHALIVLPLGALLPYSSNYMANTILTLVVLIVIFYLVNALQAYSKFRAHTYLTADRNTALVTVNNFLGNRES